MLKKNIKNYYRIDFKPGLNQKHKNCIKNLPGLSDSILWPYKIKGLNQNG